MQSRFRRDDGRRFLLRCELDAAFFHLYGLSHDDAAYVLDTFSVVRKREEAKHGEYRSARVILEVYDRMADAARTGVPYVSLLDPPPADHRIAHPPRNGGRANLSGLSLPDSASRPRTADDDGGG